MSQRGEDLRGAGGHSSADGRYRQLADAIEQGYCVIDVIFDGGGRPMDYRFIEANATFARQTGLEDALGRTARELVPDLEPHWFETYGRVAATGQPERFVHGSEAMGRWFDVHAFCIGDAGHVALLFSDITGRRQNEQALLEADRRKDEFLATLAHELRNPLAPIRTSLHVLRMSEDPATVRRLHEIMARQVDQLTRLVDELTDVSRISRGTIDLRLEPLDLGMIVRSAVESSRAQIDGGGHVLSLDIAASPVRVRGDVARMVQVVTSLLDNAIRYSEPGMRIAVRLAEDAGHALLEVTDTGRGLAPGELDTIFELFNRLERTRGRERGGLGIGLTLVRSLVAMHGGSIEARSKGAGSGSQFLVRLPLLESPVGDAAASEAQQPGTSGTLAGLRVLVVDDNRDAADSFGDWLQQFGAEARVVHDGRTALGLLTGAMPDVVLLDIDMPEMDGYELARRIRALPHAAGVTLIAITGWGQALDGLRADEGCFDHQMSKPPDIPALHQLLQALRGSRGR
ncbi:MAG TPA: ATP-binding protein [Luteimonas sp.]|nr:ATP-binding protein [Luteimonas sp.]